MRWPMPFISALGKQKQADSREFATSLVYIERLSQTKKKSGDLELIMKLSFPPQYELSLPRI